MPVSTNRFYFLFRSELLFLCLDFYRCCWLVRMSVSAKQLLIPWRWCSSVVVDEDHGFTLWVIWRFWRVRRWLIDPMRARKDLPHVEHFWVGTGTSVLAVLSVRAARLRCAFSSRSAFAALAPCVILLCHDKQFWVWDSQEYSVDIETSEWDFKRYPVGG